MIALLGLMVAVLTLISGLFAAAVAVIGFFGFTTIRDEAIRRAEKAAEQTANSTAEQIATRITAETLNQMWAQLQASGMSEGQAEPDTHISSPTSPTPEVGSGGTELWSTFAQVSSASPKKMHPLI